MSWLVHQARRLLLAAIAVCHRRRAMRCAACALRAANTVEDIPARSAAQRAPVCARASAATQKVCGAVQAIWYVYALRVGTDRVYDTEENGARMRPALRAIERKAPGAYSCRAAAPRLFIEAGACAAREHPQRRCDAGGARAGENEPRRGAARHRVMRGCASTKATLLAAQPVVTRRRCQPANSVLQ